MSKICNAEKHGIIYRVIVFTLAIFTSFFLIVSVVLSPLFIYGFKEYIRQCERQRYDNKYKKLLQIAKEHGTHSFLKGRIAPLDTIDINLWGSTRKHIIKDLELKKEELKGLSDKVLVRMAATKYDDFLERYNLRIS